jgi:hypothetical protein
LTEIADLTGPVDILTTALAEHGYVCLSADTLLAHLGPMARQAWREFALSWDALGPDLYMADGGRYRRRRHAALRVSGGAISPKPRQPHFQSRDYNALNGDVQRWFEPVLPETLANPVLQAILAAWTPVISAAGGHPADQAWHVELHQFRIETSPAETGRPTPEGLHRDGVDWVFVMLVDRRNVSDGVTEIGDEAGRPIGQFTLTTPGDGVLLDDHRIRHGVTPIRPIDPDEPAWRDALVVTWRAETS